MMIYAIMPWPLLIADYCKINLKRWLDKRKGLKAMKEEEDAEKEESKDDDYSPFEE